MQITWLFRPVVRVTAVVGACWQLQVPLELHARQAEEPVFGYLHGMRLQVLIWDLRDHEGGSWLTMKEAEGRPPSNEPSLDAKLRLQVLMSTHAQDGYTGPDHAAWMRPGIWGNGILMLCLSSAYPHRLLPLFQYPAALRAVTKWTYLPAGAHKRGRGPSLAAGQRC